MNAPSTLRTISAGLACALVGAALSCFSGQDANGLPCDDSSQCGVGVDCVDGYCGGVPAGELCGNGVVDAESGEACDDGDANDDEGACTTRCQLPACGDGVVNAEGEECDDGGLSPLCTESCKFSICGDGVHNPLDDEACDDGGESATCNVDCTEVVCGDEVINAAAGEECDSDEGESESCDADCTLPSCGDGYANLSAGEVCDDGNDSDEDDCTNLCERVYFRHDGVNASGWTVNVLDGSAPDYPSGWAPTSNAQSGLQSAWYSGKMHNDHGVRELVSPMIDTSAFIPMEERFELRFRHKFRFGNCLADGLSNSNGDGAIVRVRSEAGDTAPLVPFGQTLSNLGDESQGCIFEQDSNPFEGQQAFTGSTDGSFVNVSFDVNAMQVMGPIQLVFQIATDCAGCPLDQLESFGWYVDDIVLVGVATGGVTPPP
ncbi:MAG: hypothetical protein KC636_05420 [Myxococcales bacterium]|nr:hypothetical protein [Myxococcales bacterium]